MIRNKPVDFYSGSNIYIVLSGLVGLGLAVYFLLGFSHGAYARFHEIEFRPKDSTGVFLTAVAKTDSVKLAETERVRGEMLNAKRSDTGIIRAIIDTLHARLNRVAERQYLWQYGNKDTAFGPHMYYSMSRDILYKNLTGFAETDTLSIDVGYFDHDLGSSTYSYKPKMFLHHFPVATDFFSKYPSFALWIFLGIAQMVIWFLAIPICIFIYRLVGRKDEVVPFYKKSSWIKSVALAFSTVGVFCLLVYLFIIDKLIISDVYFMDGFVSRLIWYAFFGYLVSALSFTGYLFIANHIYQLQKDYQGGAAAIRELKIQTPAAAEATGDPSATPKALLQQITDNDALKQQYIVAKKYFSIYFYITAGVLSIVVLWVGSLFSSLNSMDTMRYYTYISGLNFLPNDFVYLFGGLHSVLLLIFFLPVQLNMFSLNSLIPDLEDKSNPTNSWGTLIKNLGSNIGNLLVVSSPILASLLHGVINSYVNK